MRLFLFVLKFFLLGAFFIVSNNNLALSDSNKRAEFFLSYKVWLGEISENIVSATGHVIKLEWLPRNDDSRIIINSEKLNGIER